MRKFFFVAAMALVVGMSGAMAQTPEQQQPNGAKPERQLKPRAERVAPGELQRGPRDGRPHHHGDQGQNGPQKMRSKTIGKNADGISLDIVYFFPEVKSVKQGEKNTQVFDANGNLLGYVAYSMPDGKDIRGHGGETPVMVAVNKQKVVLGVYMLPNLESPNYLDRIEQAGFLNHWNGLKLKDAIKKKVDTISGATQSTSALLRNVQIAFGKL